MKKGYILGLLLLLCGGAFAQAPAISWTRNYGGSWSDFGYIIHQVADSGYIMAGMSNSTNWDVATNRGSYDVAVMKLKQDGSVEWERSFGGNLEETTYNIMQTTDGGYIFAGISNSTDGDITNPHGGNDVWVVKMAPDGAMQWQKSYGGAYHDAAQAMCQAPDGGYVIVGYSYTLDSVWGPGSINADYYVLKISSTGAVEWQKRYGGSWGEIAADVKPTLDGGYIVCGTSNSSDSIVAGHGGSDYWVVKLSGNGTMEWQKALGGSGEDYCQSIVQNSDSSYLVVGGSSSNNGDVTGHINGSDFWVVKLSPTGNIIWNKNMGSGADDLAYSIRPTNDSNFILAGIVHAGGHDVTGYQGSFDYWVVKMNPAGNIMWQKALAGSSIDTARYCEETLDGGFIVMGTTLSHDGEIDRKYGEYDFWVAKLGAFPDGVPDVAASNTYTCSPNPTLGKLQIKGQAITTSASTNTLGQLIKETADPNNVSLADYPAGLYIVNIFGSKGKLLHTENVEKQ